MMPLVKKYNVGSNIEHVVNSAGQASIADLPELYKTVFDFAPDAIIVADRQGKILLANKMVNKMLGYEVNELIGKEVETLIPLHLIEKHRAHRQSYVQNAHFREMGGGKVLLALKKDKTIINAEISLSYFGSGSERLVLAAIRDTTEKRQIALKLENTLADLQSKNEELENFASIASHDLQEPLRTISSFISLLKTQYWGKLAPEADEYLQFIISATDRMRNLIKGLLDYSKTGVDSSLQYVDVGRVLETLIEDLGTHVKTTSAIIDIKTMPVITANETGIRLVFQNLIGNALKYQRKDVQPQIEISAERKKGEWIFSVKDNGIGIDPKFGTKIFEIFQRLHSRHEYEGVGIGLAHCKKIVERLKGKIWVASTPGEGSTFYFSLPDPEGTSS